MIPASFDESNHVLGKPAGMSHEQCEALSVCVAQYGDGTPVVISCWKPTREEIDEIARTGRVWLAVFGTTMQPVFLSGISPFK